MFFLTKEVTKDIPAPFRLHTVTVNCHSSSFSHLFPGGKRKDEKKEELMLSVLTTALSVCIETLFDNFTKWER